MAETLIKPRGTLIGFRKLFLVASPSFRVEEGRGGGGVYLHPRLPYGKEKKRDRLELILATLPQHHDCDRV